MSMFEILEYRLNRQIQDFVGNPWNPPSLCSVIDWAQGQDVLTYRQAGAARRVIKRQLAGMHPSHPFAIWVLAPQTERYSDRIGEDGRRYAGNLWRCWCRAVLNIADKECVRTQESRLRYGSEAHYGRASLDGQVAAARLPYSGTALVSTC